MTQPEQAPTQAAPSHTREQVRHFAARMLKEDRWSWETAREYLAGHGALVGTEEKNE